MAWRTSVGLDIGSHGVYVAEITGTRRATELTNFGGLALPDGAVEDGEVIDIDAVADTVRDLFEAAGIRGRRVHIGLGNQHVVVRQVDLRDVQGGDLAPALRAQLQEHLSIPLDAELGYQQVEELAGEDGTRMWRVLLVAADREVVASHAEAASRAGLRPVGVDLNAFANLRCALLDAGSAAETQMLVDVGSSVTDILVHDRGVPRYVRILFVGRDDVTQRVADELVGAIRGSLGYYRAAPGEPPVERVLLTGGGSKLSGFVRRLEDVLEVPVERAHPLDHLEVADTDHARADLVEVEPLLATAIGLALGGSRARGTRVDLLPGQYRRRERERRVRTIVAATGLALVLVPAGLYALRVVRARWSSGSSGDGGSGGRR